MSKLDGVEHNKYLWYLLLFCVAVLLGTLIVGAVQGITIQTHETTTSDGYGTFQPSRDCARGPDNIIRHVYPTTDLAVNLSYSSDNGASWTEIQILSPAYQGATQVYARGIIVSGNNTTCVLVYTVDADSKYDLYLLIRWGWAGNWINYHIFTHATLQAYSPQLALNDTNVLLIMFGWNTPTLCWYLFYLNNRDQYPNYGTNPTSWLSPSWNEWGQDFQLWTNLTGKFWVAWTDSHTYPYMNARDFCATKTLVAYQLSNSLGWYLNAVQVMPTTGDAIYLYGANYSAYSYEYIYMYYIRDNKNYFQGPGLLQTFTGSERIFEAYLGLSVDATGYTYIFWYSGTNHKIRGMKNYYWEVATEWTASAYDVNSGYTSTDYINCANGLGSLWPQVSGTVVNNPKTGYFMSWIWKDEKGATDDYNYQVAYGTTTWPTINWGPILITNTDTVSGHFYVQSYITWDLGVTGGNSPYVWSVIDMSGWTGTGSWLGITDDGGIVYGQNPPSAGNYWFRVEVEDLYGRVAYANITVRVQTVGGGGGAAPSSVSWSFPTLSEQGELWFLLAGISITACIIGSIRNLAARGRKRRSE